MPPFAHGDWDEEFKNDMKRGHVSIPKRGPHNGLNDEVWGALGKRNTKRLTSRRNRRIGKRIDREEYE